MGLDRFGAFGNGSCRKSNADFVSAPLAILVVCRRQKQVVVISDLDRYNA